jgi:uncharacterized membrane protein
MALLRELPGRSVRNLPISHLHGLVRAWGRFGNPLTVFIVLSVAFGLGALIVNPPLRGPDEAAHFLRVVAITEGEIVPSMHDEGGRKGTFISAAVHDDFDFFEAARYKVGTPGFTYWEVVDDYRRRHSRRVAQDTRPPVFVVYQGSEAYSPASYLPYIVAAPIGRALGLDFLGLFYLMRIAGFIAMTAVAAYAIAIVPHLKWTFFLIAMLPSALYGRTVLGADGAALSFTLVGTALCLRSAYGLNGRRIWERAAFMTLCGLSKPPQVAFLALEFMAHPLRELPRHWRAVALVMLPSLILTALWAAATALDVGTWRMIEGANMPAELFDPKRKLLLLLNDPLHFAALVIASLSKWDELWRQLIGVLGWLDTHLRDWVYAILSGLLVASFVGPLPLPRARRYQIAAASVLAVIAYFVAVYLIFYLAWTPADAPSIPGVQGRYFVVALAPLALACAAVINWGPREMTKAAIAICGATLSGAAVIEALLRVNW